MPETNPNTTDLTEGLVKDALILNDGVVMPGMLLKTIFWLLVSVVILLSVMALIKSRLARDTLRTTCKSRSFSITVFATLPRIPEVASLHVAAAAMIERRKLNPFMVFGAIS